MRLLGQKVEVLQAIVAAHAPQAMQFPQQPLPQQVRQPGNILRIPNFSRNLTQAIIYNDYGRIESEPFFTSHGYKMKLRIQLNQEPCGLPGYMGAYVALMKSDRDENLPWPFTKRVEFVVVDQQDDPDQRQNIKYQLVPRGENNFNRPTQRENTGRGLLDFVEHSALSARQYIRDDTVLIMVMVDP